MATLLSNLSTSLIQFGQRRTSLKPSALRSSRIGANTSLSRNTSALPSTSRQQNQCLQMAGSHLCPSLRWVWPSMRRQVIINSIRISNINSQGCWWAKRSLLLLKGKTICLYLMFSPNATILTHGNLSSEITHLTASTLSMSRFKRKIKTQIGKYHPLRRRACTGSTTMKGFQSIWSHGLMLF